MRPPNLEGIIGSIRRVSRPSQPVPGSGATPHFSSADVVRVGRGSWDRLRGKAGYTVTTKTADAAAMPAIPPSENFDPAKFAAEVVLPTAEHLAESGDGSAEHKLARQLREGARAGAGGWRESMGAVVASAEQGEHQAVKTALEQRIDSIGQEPRQDSEGNFTGKSARSREGEATYQSAQRVTVTLESILDGRLQDLESYTQNVVLDGLGRHITDSIGGPLADQLRHLTPEEQRQILKGVVSQPEYRQALRQEIQRIIDRPKTTAVAEAQQELTEAKERLQTAQAEARAKEKALQRTDKEMSEYEDRSGEGGKKGRYHDRYRRLKDHQGEWEEGVETLEEELAGYKGRLSALREVNNAQDIAERDDLRSKIAGTEEELRVTKAQLDRLEKYDAEVSRLEQQKEDQQEELNAAKKVVGNRNSVVTAAESAFGNAKQASQKEDEALLTALESATVKALSGWKEQRLANLGEQIDDQLAARRQTEMDKQRKAFIEHLEARYKVRIETQVTRGGKLDGKVVQAGDVIFATRVNETQVVQDSSTLEGEGPNSLLRTILNEVSPQDAERLMQDPEFVGSMQPMLIAKLEILRNEQQGITPKHRLDVYRSATGNEMFDNLANRPEVQRILAQHGVTAPPGTTARREQMEQALVNNETVTVPDLANPGQTKQEQKGIQFYLGVLSIGLLSVGMASAQNTAQSEQTQGH